MEGSIIQSQPGLIFIESSEIQNAVDRTVSAALHEINLTQPLAEGDFAIAAARIDRQRRTLYFGGHNLHQAFYPASVVKLFFGVFAISQVLARALEPTPEFERALDEMLSKSVNDATALIVDILTDTTGGPELSPGELEVWMTKRQVVNRYFQEAGYTRVNACQKTWNEGPYGRERQGYGPNRELTNRLTAYESMRLMAELFLDRAFVDRVESVDPSGSNWPERLKGYLKRCQPAKGPTDDEQSLDYSSKHLPPEVDIYSKAGWTDAVRHDVVWCQHESGQEFAWAIFTQNHSNDPELLQTSGEILFRQLQLTLDQ